MVPLPSAQQGVMPRHAWRAQAFTAAIAAARKVFDMGAALGFGMRLLDLGGGFVSWQARGGQPSLGGVPAAVNAALDALFPAGCGVRIIAEPGRRAARLLMLISI